MRLEHQIEGARLCELAIALIWVQLGVLQAVNIGGFVLTEAKLARLQRWLAAQPDEPVADTRSVDEIIGYDDRGLPR